MNKNLRKFLFLQAGVFFLVTILQAQPAQPKALLWKVSGNGLQEPSYLFGTYHLLNDGFLSEIPEADAPFKKAKGVVVEMVFDSSKLVSIAMMGVMRDNKISNLMSAEDFKLVSDKFEKISGMTLKTMDMFKPAQVNAMMVLLESQKLNETLLSKYKGLPLDLHFAIAGKKQGKVVTPLETMEEQITMLFDHFPVEEQARQLVEYVKNSDTMAKTHVELANLYVQKDIGGLLKIIESYPSELTGNVDFMLKDRNVKWAKVLPALMSSGSQFIAVGAGHLPGKDGLIALLKQAGYDVEPVTK